MYLFQLCTFHVYIYIHICIYVIFYICYIMFCGFDLSLCFFSIPIYISRTRDCSNACEPQGPCGGRTPALCDGPCRPPDVFVFLFAVHTRAGEHDLLGTCLSSPVISQQHCYDKCSNCIRLPCGFRGSGLRPSGLWAKLSTHRSISPALWHLLPFHSTLPK